MLAKKLTPERVSVTIEEGKVSVIIRDETRQQEYDLTTQLYGPIITAESRWELLSTKVSPRRTGCSRSVVSCASRKKHPHPRIRSWS